jgi:hypothetical protein
MKRRIHEFGKPNNLSRGAAMKLYAFLPSTRVLGVIALMDHPGIACNLQEVDLSTGDQKNVRCVVRQTLFWG